MAESVNHKEAKAPQIILLVIRVVAAILALFLIWFVWPKIFLPCNQKNHSAYSFEYKFSAGQKVYTKVKVGQGINLQLWASKPFYVVTDQLAQLANETTIRESREYWMPAGESSWTGGDPVGLFTLRGETDGTIVKIKVL